MLRILVADKDPMTMHIVHTRLTPRGYEVIECSDKNELLGYLEKERVDLILLSDEMDHLGSLLLVEKIRQKSHLHTVPIVMICDEHHLPELLVGQETGFDDFLIKPFSSYVLQLRISLAIKRTRDRVEANALTHLPGNHAIERMVMGKIEKREKFSVLYMDINNFKSFNDVYGFDKGDDVIRHTAKLLIKTASECELAGEHFIGHIGGDDFVAVLHPDDEEVFARAFIEEFDRIIVTYYNEVDRKRGYIRVMNRRGKRETFPLMSCSVAACNNLHRDYRNLGEISQDIAEVKSFLKSQPGSHYLRDRRCEPIKQVEEALEILTQETKNNGNGNGNGNGSGNGNGHKKTNGKTNGQMEPLGKVLLDAGLITEEQLSSALRKHFETGKRLGQILISMEAVKSEDVGTMLERKLRIPYVSLKNYTPPKHVLRLFNLEFVHMRRVLPLEIIGDELRLGMCDPYDIRTLDDIERITSLRPIPCLTLEDEFEKFLEQWEPEFSREEKLV